VCVLREESVCVCLALGHIWVYEWGRDKMQIWESECRKYYVTTHLSEFVQNTNKRQYESIQQYFRIRLTAALRICVCVGMG
jgi:hypothetical protein